MLDFAKNAQVEKAEYMPAKLDFIRSYVPVPETDPEAVKAAAELINGAERPLVLVGQGVELGNAQQELRAFIEKADMPAGCTLLGLSALPTEHPLNKGMLGMHGNLGPNMNTNKCDVLIAVGMRFDDRVTGNLATYAKQAKAYLPSDAIPDGLPFLLPPVHKAGNYPTILYARWAAAMP